MQKPCAQGGKNKKNQSTAGQQIGQTGFMKKGNLEPFLPEDYQSTMDENQYTAIMAFQVHIVLSSDEMRVHFSTWCLRMAMNTDFGEDGWLHSPQKLSLSLFWAILVLENK